MERSTLTLGKTTLWTGVLNKKRGSWLSIELQFNVSVNNVHALLSAALSSHHPDFISMMSYTLGSRMKINLPSSNYFSQTFRCSNKTSSGYFFEEDILCFGRDVPWEFWLAWRWGQGKKEFSFKLRPVTRFSLLVL